MALMQQGAHYCRHWTDDSTAFLLVGAAVEMKKLVIANPLDSFESLKVAADCEVLACFEDRSLSLVASTEAMALGGVPRPSGRTLFSNSLRDPSGLSKSGRYPFGPFPRLVREDGS